MMNNSVVLFGTGPLLKTCIDIFNSNGIIIFGILADTDETEIENVAVLGPIDDNKYLSVLGKDTGACVAIENAVERANVVKMLIKEYKVMPMNAIHAKAYISENANIGHGNIISAGTSIEGFADIGNHNVLKNRVAIGVGAKFGDFIEVGSGAIINENVSIGDGAFIGSGAVIVAGVEIGKNARVGAGSIVVENIPAKTTVFGNPAKKI